MTESDPEPVLRAAGIAPEKLQAVIAEVKRRQPSEALRQELVDRRTKSRRSPK